MSTFEKSNHPYGHFYGDQKPGKLVYLLIFLAVFLSACGLPKNVTLLYRDDSIAASSLLWSPDGDKLAINTIRSNGIMPPITDIYILDVKTRKTQLVVSNEFGNYLSAKSWTSDGKHVVFYAFPAKGSNYGMWLADVNSIEPPKFLAERLQLTSVNGKSAFARGNPDTQESSLYIRDDSIGDETKVFSSKGIGIQNFSWSPDGSKLIILFESSQRGNYRLYVFDANTKKTTQIIPDGDIRGPIFSPGGKMIAYLKADQEGVMPPAYLHIMKSDGSCDVEVPGHLQVHSPAWSPDGKQIAYVDNEGIYLLDLVGAFGKDIVKEGLPCP